MAEIKVPQLGESIVEATVGRWLKQEGDRITAGEPVVELETDKVNMEVPATADGTLTSIVKPEGETVGIGDVLAVVEEGAAPSTGAATAAGQTPSPTPTPSSSPSEVSAQPQPQTAMSAQAPTGPSVEPNGEGPRSTPLARRIASEHGVNLSQIEGTGPSGRVTREDVTSFIETHPGGKAQPGTAPMPPVSTQRTPQLSAAPFAPTDATAGRWEERVRMSRRRQTIAQRLVEAQQTAAMLTTFNEVDMTAIMDLRKRHRDAFKERHGVNLGYMSFFTRAVVGALKAFPRLNAEIQGDEMILKHYYDIGIAVGAEDGLVVPVVRDADRLSFAEIERQIASLAEKARNRTLTLEELQGGTFTITNGGIFGSLLSTPILNAPQVGILGMHKIQERPMAVNGEVVVRPMMYLALSYDHRIVDGREAVQFLVRVKELLEQPEVLLLEG